MKKILYTLLSLIIVTSFSCRKKDNDDFSKMLGERRWTGTDAGREYVFSHNYRDFSYAIDSVMRIRSVNKTTVDMMGSSFTLSGRDFDHQFEFTEVVGTHSRGGLTFNAQAKLTYYPVGDSIKYELHYRGGPHWEDVVMVAR